MTQPFVPTALEQLLIKQVAVNGVPFQSEGWINFTGSVTGTDNPGFTVNGVVVGATNVAITGGGGGGSPTGTGLYYTTLGVMNPAAVGFSGDVSLGSLSGGNIPSTLNYIQGHAVIAPSPSSGNVMMYLTGSPNAWRPEAAGGDITGAYTALNVAYLQGNLLTAPSPSAGQVLMWTAGDTPAWKPQSAGSSSGDITGEYTDLNVVGFNGVPLNLTAATNGQVYVFNSGSSSWVATTLSGSFAAGGDLSGSATNQEVIGLLSKALPSLTQGALFYTGSAWILGPLPTTDIAPGYDDYILGTSHTGVTAWFAPGGDVTFVSNSFEVTGLLTHALPSLTTGYLEWTGSAWAFGAGGSTSVTGTGLWYSASGSLHSAAITLDGDVTAGALSGSNVPLTVVALQGNAVASTAPTDTYVLTWSAGSSHWYPAAAGGGGSVTWANDLNGSSSTHQYVVAITGSGGAGGTVALSDGTHALSLTMMTSASLGSPPPLTVAGALGLSGAGVGGGGAVTVIAGAGNVPSTGSHTGGAGGALTIQSGAGSVGLGTGANGGAAGPLTIQAGAAAIGLTGGGAGGAGGSIDILASVGATGQGAGGGTGGTIGFIAGMGGSGSAGGAGGGLIFYTGAGGDGDGSPDDTGGSADGATFFCGDGGTAYNGNAGIGGNFVVQCGHGGATSPTGAGNPGNGGVVTLQAGIGGAGYNAAGSGGNVSIVSGVGAVGTNEAVGGNAGYTQLIASNGGAAHGTNQAGGVGGSIYISPGAGGAPTGSGARGVTGIIYLQTGGNQFGIAGSNYDGSSGFLMIGGTGASNWPSTGVFRASSTTSVPTLTHYDTSNTTTFQMVALGNPLSYGVGVLLGDNSVSNGTVIQTTSSTPIALMIGSTAYFGIATGFLGGGHGEAWFGNGTAPGSNPTGGYYVYANAGALFGRGSSGTITTIGVADLVGFMDTPGHGHCPECGTDFAHEW